MALNELHAAHIGRVKVQFSFSAKGLIPTALTNAVAIEPDSAAKRGDERRDHAGNVISPHNEGYWMLSSSGKIVSKDVDDHFAFLLENLLPHQRAINEMVDELAGETFFNVLWESSYLYTGTGPLLSLQTIQGASQLKAGIGFDIYQIG